MGTSGGIFPEDMTPFTLRAFGAFYLALGLSAIPVAITRSIDVLLMYSVAAYSLILTVSAAMIPYAGLFDLAARPGGLIYIGAYVSVGIVIGVIMFRNRDRVRQLLAA